MELLKHSSEYTCTIESNQNHGTAPLKCSSQNTISVYKILLHCIVPFTSQKKKKKEEEKNHQNFSY
jgi:hypothetical protein